MKMKWWIVEVRDPNTGAMIPFFPGPFANRRVPQDQVSFDARDTAEEVKDSLVNHDGYPSNITVRHWK